MRFTMRCIGIGVLPAGAPILNPGAYDKYTTFAVLSGAKSDGASRDVVVRVSDDMAREIFAHDVTVTVEVDGDE